LSEVKESKASPPVQELRILKFRFSLSLNDVLFPVDAREFADALSKNGYSIPPGIPYAGAKARIKFAGPIAQKPEIVVDGNSDRGIIGVTAKSYESAIAAFNELRLILKDELNIDLDKRSRFFELIAEFKCYSDNDPLKSINKKFERNRTLRDMNEILEHNVSLFGLRLTSQGVVPNQEEWLDISIEPDIINPNSIYSISIIFRSSQRVVVEEFGKKLIPNLSLIINKIEN